MSLKQGILEQKMLGRELFGILAAMGALSLLIPGLQGAALAEQVYAAGKVTAPVPLSAESVQVEAPAASGSAPVSGVAPVSPAFPASFSFSASSSAKVAPASASSALGGLAKKPATPLITTPVAAHATPSSPKPAVTGAQPAVSSATSPMKVPVKASSGTPGVISPVNSSGKSILGSVKTSVAPVTATVPSVSPAPAIDIDILRSVPLEVTGYSSAQCLPAQLSSAQDVLSVLNATPVLLVHMEALRRGYVELPVSERAKLLSELHKRHTASETDLMLGFDLGYAELVFEHNKTGLFFLRKANDHFQDQFSNLAYGMAQAEADITLENANPEELTTRKMDVMYRLGDAVKIDAARHQPGFWPSYMRVLEKLKPMGAYRSFSHRDFSLAYVPYGNSVIPLRPAVTTTTSLSETQPGSLGQLPFSGNVSTSQSPSSCIPEAGTSESPAFFGSMLSQRTASFSGKLVTVQFYHTSDPHLYQVRVVGSAASSPLLTFNTYTSANVVEDLDGDGIFEIVARQYQQDPFKPVLVYRYTPCGFTLDKKLSASFQ